MACNDTFLSKLVLVTLLLLDSSTTAAAAERLAGKLLLSNTKRDVVGTVEAAVRQR